MDNAREAAVMEFWKRNAVYQKVKERLKGKKQFYFLDGPPYATGAIHIGTAWNKILKDVYIRFWRMQGLDVWDQPGYDTHGIPIENKVEKELQLRAKHDIEKLGVEKFILSCKRFATEHIDTMNKQFANLGVWMDWDHPYLTLDNAYIEGAWHTFKVGYEKGLLYHSSYSVHVCPHCETAVAYNEIEYTKLTDPSVYVKFPVLGKTNEFLVIWTTTPWTLPSNTGIMVHPDATYVKAQANGQILIVAKELLAPFMEKIGARYDILEEIKGGSLVGTRYTNPLSGAFPFIKTIKDAHRVVPSKQYVSMVEGTGLVHTAPGHGKEDYNVGLEHNLPAVNPLKMNGTFNEQSGMFAGMFAKQADRKIIDMLKEGGFLLHEEKITHDYPVCWRCDSPLLQMAVPQWFFKVTAIRSKLLKENEKIRWQPDWAQQRFANWLENLGDWPISRQRYWGIPLPIWRCECGEVKVIGSKDELPYAPIDLHRPYIDAVTLQCACGGTMKRIPDVLDVWFDSGLAAWASLGYPKNKEVFDKLFPSDFQTEGPDQFRGWWNSEIITSVITFGKAPFKNILLHGFVLDAHGDKMSKSRGNIVQPEDVIAKHGRDVLRLYLVSSPPWEDFYFKWVDAEATAKTFAVIENTFNFVKSYVQPEQIRKPERLNAEDKWILSRLNSLVKLYTSECKRYNAHKAAAALHVFLLNDFSRFYIKLVRDRVWPSYSGKDKEAAFYTLYEVALESAKLLAPLCPFLAERVYQDVLRPLGAKEESVHFEKLPKADERFVDKELEAQVDLAKAIIEAANALRHEQRRKLRWPLRKMYITADVIEEVKHLIMTMCNVKEIGRGSHASWPSKSFGSGTLYLDIAITGELKTEALLREVVRKVQDMRKKSGLVVQDRISLTLQNCDELKKFQEQVSKEVGAEIITFGKADGESFAFDEREISVAIRKLASG